MSFLPFGRIQAFIPQRAVRTAILCAIMSTIASIPIATAESQCNPQITIDSPAPNSASTGQIVISGWAIDQSSTSGSGISTVQVLQDGQLNTGGMSLGNVSPIPRPDVDSALGRSGTFGFRLSVDASNIAPGPHTFYVYAATACGQANAAVAVVVQPAPAAPAVVDAPAPPPNSGGLDSAVIVAAVNSVPLIPGVSFTPTSTNVAVKPTSIVPVFIHFDITDTNAWSRDSLALRLQFAHDVLSAVHDQYPNLAPLPGNSHTYIYVDFWITQHVTSLFDLADSFSGSAIDKFCDPAPRSIGWTCIYPDIATELVLPGNVYEWTLPWSYDGDTFVPMSLR